MFSSHCGPGTIGILYEVKNIKKENIIDIKYQYVKIIINTKKRKSN